MYCRKHKWISYRDSFWCIADLRTGPGRPSVIACIIEFRCVFTRENVCVCVCKHYPQYYLHDDLMATPLAYAHIHPSTLYKNDIKFLGHLLSGPTSSSSSWIICWGLPPEGLNWQHYWIICWVGTISQVSVDNVCLEPNINWQWMPDNWPMYAWPLVATKHIMRNKLPEIISCGDLKQCVVIEIRSLRLSPVEMWNKVII